MSNCLCRFYVILLTFYFLGSLSVAAQSSGASWTDTVDGFLSEKQIKKADSVLNQQKSIFLSRNQVDSLHSFPYYIGRIINEQQNAKAAASRAEAFVAELKERTTNARTLYKAYLSLEELYIDLGDDASSVIASKKALEYAQSLPDVKFEELGKINYAIGSDYYALYNLSEALDYFRASANAYEQSQTVEKDILADAYNGVATAMWTLNKLDSAQIYYKKAIASTKESNLKGYDRIYYIIAFQFNLALVIDAQGRLGEAIEMKRSIIPQLQEIIENSDDEELIKKSKRLLASAVSNLAAFYNDTGYLTKAYEMLKFSYEKKKEVFELTSPRMATALTQIALCEFELREFDKSIETADMALRNLKKAPSRYPAVEADIYAIQAKSHAANNNIVKASELYEKALELFQEAYPSEYSQEYLIFLRAYSQFLANHAHYDKALEIANGTYDYMAGTGVDNNFPIIKEISNLSEIYYKSGNYEKAHEWAVKGNSFLDDRIRKAASGIDSIQIEFRRPEITLMEVQSLYKITAQKDRKFLESQIEKINKAVAALEQRKTTAFNLADINNILTEYKALNSFSKKLNFELFQLTGEEKYLDKTISLHESGIYNRLRTQLNIKKDIRFGSLPASVLEREKELKENISNALKTDHRNKINDYFSASTQWVEFLDSIRVNFPKYYSLRYATIEESPGNIQQKIPEQSTVVRYFFIEDQLYAFVINKNERAIIPLDYKEQNNLISLLGEDQSDLRRTSDALTQLYNILWKPLEDKIPTEKVIIIPDRELFNLSFETLTPKKIDSFSELATTSLLSKYIISYNYSLFLINKESDRETYERNFVAFAPEFSEEMKNDYWVSLRDSSNLDKSYISLLPQPFSAELVEEYASSFNGTSYINERSTKQVFRNNAREHKIIHIGTHAESNNITPEFSRLIFAKDISEQTSDEDNSLFSYEIYDYNLASNLTILTACETGKPGFEPGEGMISLAHAFNYAGSESMLTSLWKIDEQSSTMIIEYFYDNLAKGMARDKALQQAKLSYLASAEGRTIAPHYWAGLVLIGDTHPLDLSTPVSIWYWIMGMIFLLAVLLFIFFRRK
jgi:CHAT domain-containing protein